MLGRYVLLAKERLGREYVEFDTVGSDRFRAHRVGGIRRSGQNDCRYQGSGQEPDSRRGHVSSPRRKFVIETLSMSLHLHTRHVAAGFGAHGEHIEVDGPFAGLLKDQPRFDLIAFAERLL